MSAAATAAGYLFASGIIDKRRQKRALEVRYCMTERYDGFDRISEGTFQVEPRQVKVTYRKRRMP